MPTRPASSTRGLTTDTAATIHACTAVRRGAVSAPERRDAAPHGRHPAQRSAPLARSVNPRPEWLVRVPTVNLGMLGTAARRPPANTATVTQRYRVV